MTDYRAGGYAHFPGSYAGPARVGLTCAGCRFASHVSTKYRTDHFCEIRPPCAHRAGGAGLQILGGKAVIDFLLCLFGYRRALSPWTRLLVTGAVKPMRRGR